MDWVAWIKVIGMVLTALFVGGMVYRSVRVVKEREDDRVHLPD